jgi:hypothetical protein
MFNSEEVKTSGSGVIPGINTVDVEMIYAPLKEGNEAALQLKVVNTNFKKVFWEPKKVEPSFARVAGYNWEFGGQKATKGETMNIDQCFAFDCMDLTQQLKTILKAVGIEAAFKAATYTDLCKEVVKLFGSAKKADIKLTYDKNGYLSFPKFGYIAAPNSGVLKLNPQYDKITKDIPATEHTSTGAPADLPF